MPFCCFIAFFKHVELCFRPLSDFVIPHVKMLGSVYWNRCVLVSISLCICLPGFVQKVSSEQFNLLYPNLIIIVVHLPETVCHAQESGCYLQGQGHNKGLYNHNMTVSTISSELTISFATELSLLVDHHKPEHTLKICYCCVRSQSHSNGSKFNLMFVCMVPSEPLKL